MGESSGFARSAGDRKAIGIDGSQYGGTPWPGLRLRRAMICSWIHFRNGFTTARIKTIIATPSVAIKKNGQFLCHLRNCQRSFLKEHVWSC